MPTTPAGFSSVMADVDQFLSVLANAQVGLPEQRERDLMGVLLSRLQEARQAATEVIPKAMGNLQQCMEQYQVAAEKLKAEIREQQQKLADLEASPPVRVPGSTPPPPPVEPPTIDPALGQKLREELLAKLFGTTPPVAPPRPGKDIWQDWESS